MINGHQVFPVEGENVAQARASGWSGDDEFLLNVQKEQLFRIVQTMRGWWW
jgi:hypothetical protein